MPETGVGRVIDPTKNVLDLVEAAIKRIDDLSRENFKRLDERIDAIAGRMDSENRHQSGLRFQQEMYDTRIEGIKTEYQKQIAAILSSQSDRSATILAQAVEKLTNATDVRLAAVEKNQYASGGQIEGRSKGFSDVGAFILGGFIVLSVLIAAATFVMSKT